MKPPYLQRKYRQLQRKLSGFLASDTKVRSKRSISVSLRRHHRQIHKKPSSTNRHRWGAIAPALLRLKRSSHTDQHFARTVGNVMHRDQRNGHIDPHEAAYMRYYEKIRQKHRNYISNLLRAHHANASSSHNIDRQLMHAGPSMNRLLHYTANENELNRNADIHHHQDDTSAANAVFQELNVLASLPIPLPNINENMKKVMHHSQPFVNNTYVGRNHLGSSRRISEHRNSTAVSNPYNFEKETMVINQISPNRDLYDWLSWHLNCNERSEMPTMKPTKVKRIERREHANRARYVWHLWTSEFEANTLTFNFSGDSNRTVYSNRYSSRR